MSRIFENIFDVEDDESLSLDSNISGSGIVMCEKLKDIPDFQHDITFKFNYNMIKYDTRLEYKQIKEYMFKYFVRIFQLFSTQDYITEYYVCSFMYNRNENFHNVTIYYPDTDPFEFANDMYEKYYELSDKAKHVFFYFTVNFNVTEDFTYEWFSSFSRKLTNLNIHYMFNNINHHFDFLDKNKNGFAESGDLEFKYSSDNLVKIYNMIFPDNAIRKVPVVKANMHYNGPVKLSSKSEKRMEDFNPMDFLFET